MHRSLHICAHRLPNTCTLLGAEQCGTAAPTTSQLSVSLGVSDVSGADHSRRTLQIGLGSPQARVLPGSGWLLVRNDAAAAADATRRCRSDRVHPWRGFVALVASAPPPPILTRVPRTRTHAGRKLPVRRREPWRRGVHGRLGLPGPAPAWLLPARRAAIRARHAGPQQRDAAVPAAAVVLPGVDGEPEEPEQGCPRPCRRQGVAAVVRPRRRAETLWVIALTTRTCHPTLNSDSRSRRQGYTDASFSDLTALSAYFLAYK
jgi:hypothetical protein